MAVIEGPIMFDGGIIVDNQCLGETFECKIADEQVYIELPNRELHWFEDFQGASVHQTMVPPKWEHFPEDASVLNLGTKESEVPGVSNIDGSFGPGTHVWGSNMTARNMVYGETVDGSSNLLIGRMYHESALPPEGRRSLAWDIMYDLPRFWATAKNWIESISLQNLTSINSSDASRRFHARVMWSLEGEHVEGYIPGGSLHTFYPSRFVLTSVGLKKLFEIAGNRVNPPAEWLLIRDAYRDYHFRDYSNAVISCSTALELILNSYRDFMLAEQLPGVRGYFSEKNMTLGPKLELLTKYLGLVLPNGSKTLSIIQLRNHAIHKGITPQDREVFNAVEEVRDLLLNLDSEYKELTDLCIVEDPQLIDLTEHILSDESYYLNSVGLSL